MTCVVLGCKNSKSVAKTKPISFHMLPKNIKLRKQWINFAGRDDTFQMKTASICNEHFVSDDFENNMQFSMGFARNRILKSNAIPSRKVVKKYGKKVSKDINRSAIRDTCYNEQCTKTDALNESYPNGHDNQEYRTDEEPIMTIAAEEGPIFIIEEFEDEPVAEMSSAAVEGAVFTNEEFNEEPEITNMEDSNDVVNLTITDESNSTTVVDQSETKEEPSQNLDSCSCSNQLAMVKNDQARIEKKLDYIIELIHDLSRRIKN